MSVDSEIIDPLHTLNESQAAQQVVIELIRTGCIQTANSAAECFTFLFEHYRSEKNRVLTENKAQ
ncbi:hypothetical protein TUM17576_41910 [Enterobacter hormaechei]|nr:hypothetical protein TUM17576_41910 [Enterobacter hormaechei]